MPFLVLASLFVGAWISVALHEASHAAAARLANLQIKEIRVGKGPTVFRTRLLETDIYLDLIPMGGWVWTFPSLRYSKSARLFFYAAGPAMDLTWFAVLITTLVTFRDSELTGVSCCLRSLCRVRCFSGILCLGMSDSTASGCRMT